MASRSKTHQPVKYKSKRVCEEKFDCDGSNASYECLNCGTRQCEHCEQLLHKPERPKFASHIRRKIEQLPCAVECALCPYNPAEFSCLECRTVICQDCNKEYHRGKLTGHRRTPLPKQKQNKEVASDTTHAQQSPTSEMNPSKSSPENCLPLSPFLDSLSEPTPCEIKERQTTILTGDISSSSTGLNLIDELTLDSDFHSLTMLDKKPSLSTPDDNDIERDEFLSLESVSSGQGGPKSLEFLSGHFESLEKPSIAQSNAIAIPKAPESNVNRSAGGCMTVTHRTTRAHGKPGSGRNVNKHGAGAVHGGHGERVVTSSGNPQGSHPKTEDIQSNQPFLDQTSSPSPRHSEFFRSNSGSGEWTPSQGQPLSHSLESSGGRKRMEAIVKPVGSVKAVPSSPREKQVESKKKTPSSPQPPPPPVNELADLEAAEDEIDLVDPNHAKGFLLVDDSETLQVNSAEALVEKLKCELKTPVKVISIFGNTGDGKSHTLNHTFFGGQEVFHTSPTQESCTIGVWVAYDERTNIIVVDTEGLLGVSSNENKRTRLLLKVIAISDVVIYRTRADRLHRDLFQFLGDASKAYLKHFTPELKVTLEKCKIKGPVSTLGPAVIVFHETTHTLPLGAVQPQRSTGGLKSADTLLQERFKEHGCHMDAFSCVQYIGIQTIKPPTNFKPLKEAILTHVYNSTVRSPRSPQVVYHALKGLNDKFSGAIDREVPSPFPDEYFTCSTRCLSCNARCTNTMNHIQDNIIHENLSRCKYQHQFDNRVYICKSCYQGGQEVVVVPKMCSATDNSWMGMIKYAVSGFVLECPHCGVIYRSRQYWYGNQEPEMEAVRTEIRHVWPGGSTVLQGTHNAGRRLLDGIHQVVDVVSSVSAKPTTMMSQWMMDQIAPPYWRPNAEITACHRCGKKFDETEKLHHCRECGEGFCDECSQHQLPVPERGWGPKPVRVCDGCFQKKTSDVGGGKMPAVDDLQAELESAMNDEPQPVMARKVGEVLQTTLGVLGTAVNYPAGMLIEAARPAYWIPDSEITHCIACKEEFTPKLKIHHCRGCGQGVCVDCSASRRPVPSRGWDMPVRVCSLCNAKEGQL
ncbi:zinc finger FYVE domain-containing protein 1-like [Lytechinus variegatus]|uniref:zinc finger FYVE domain-containing protein 1-like n=1 Tax=Lytechinus variegatus TaxID=7654 RepID=UPI001BB1259D|nr:zinc finger FYVE domain-containing protein 1-like [Lytechinus variegatus]